MQGECGAWLASFPGSTSQLFYFFLPAGARAARERLVLRLLYVFRICLFVCLCVRTYHMRNILRHTLLCNCSVHAAAFGGLQAKLQQMKVVLCCLDGENVIGSREDPGFLAYSY